MYKIKEIPEDFVVKELSNVKISNSGRYGYFLMKKREYTTIRAVQHIANAIGVKAKDIGFAGNKDKKAITEQMISIKDKGKEAEGIRLKDIELKFVGKGAEPISLGDSDGNEFEIVVRNVERALSEKKGVVNYFGEQRFGKNNADVGKAIVNKDFKKAVELLGDDVELEGGDYVGALRKLPKKLLMMYVHSYQSKLWNETVKKYLDSECPFKDSEVPMIGFGLEFEKIDDLNLRNVIEKIMEKESVNERDFIIRQIPELSAEGGSRKMIVKVDRLSISELEEDEINKGKKKLEIKFKLGKGSYATEVVRQMFA